MARKQVTRMMANSAAKELAKIAYDKKIKQALEEERAFGDALIKKYIPNPILAVGEEYKNFFNDRSSIIGIQPVSGSNYYSITINSNIVNPISRKYIQVDEADYKKGKSLREKVTKLGNMKQQYIDQVSDALMQLKSENRITQNFPEALPFLNFTETTTLMPQFDNLRALLKS